MMLSSETTPMPSKQPFRKPDFRHGGIQVRICGRPLGYNRSLICGLPLHGRDIPHATVAIGDQGQVVAAIEHLGTEEVEMWQLEGPHESPK